MEDTLEKEFKRLKEELAKKREEVQDIANLIHEGIDRHFQINSTELSERELEAFLGEKLAMGKQYIDIEPDPGALRSHRKILGRPILFFKRMFMKMIRFYSQQITSKQTQFNENAAALLEAIVSYSRRNRQELLDIQEKIGRLEETAVLLLASLKDLKEKLGKQKAQALKE